MKPIYLLIGLLLVCQVSIAAGPSVKVLGLFTDKALLLIDGERKLMRKGESLKGVTLISASGRGAVVQLSSGEKRTVGLNQSISSAFKKSTRNRHTIYADRAGMFKLDGQINGKRTRFLLDTGASYIALSEVEADRLGLAYEAGQRSLAHTASDVVPVWNVKLDSVTVGNISVPQVEAVVLRGSQPRTVLLGMSFLQHLKLERNGASMILQQKY